MVLVSQLLAGALLTLRASSRCWDSRAERLRIDGSSKGTPSPRFEDHPQRQDTRVQRPLPALEIGPLIVILGVRTVALQYRAILDFVSRVTYFHQSLSPQSPLAKPAQLE